MRRLAPALLVLAGSVLVVAGCGPGERPGGDAGSAASGEEDAGERWTWTEAEIRERMARITAGPDLNPREWPGGARVAVLLSFDVDDGTVHLEGDPPSPRALSRGEYGPRRGLGRVLDLLDRHDIPASFFVPAVSLMLYPEIADAVGRSGRHEVGVHGWIHERNTELSAERERELTRRAVEYLTRATGERPVGYRAPSWDFSPHTLDILRDLGFLYDSSLMADDRPYRLVQEGDTTAVVELPVSWILDDWPHMNPMSDRYAPPRQVLEVWKDEFDRALAEGTLFVLTMHPQVIGRRSRIVVLEELIDHMLDTAGRERVWFATHRQAAEYVREAAGP